MRITNPPTTPVGWNPHQDPDYIQFRTEAKKFLQNPSKETAEHLRNRMLGKSYRPLVDSFQVLASYIAPSSQSEAFSFFSNTFWALHEYIQDGGDPSIAKLWLSRLQEVLNS